MIQISPLFGYFVHLRSRKNAYLCTRKEIRKKEFKVIKVNPSIKVRHLVYFIRKLEHKVFRLRICLCKVCN